MKYVAKAQIMDDANNRKWCFNYHQLSLQE